MSSSPVSSTEPPFHYFHIPTRPHTLTIVRNVRSIVQSMYSIATFVWIEPEENQWAAICRQFQDVVEEQLICCRTVFEAKEIISRLEIVVVICEQLVLEDDACIFEKQCKQMKINQILCIGNSFPHNSKLITFLNSHQQLLTLINHNKSQYNTAKDFTNFIFVQADEHHDSDTTIRTLRNMNNQPCNRQQMIHYMGQVARVLCPAFRRYSIEEFVKQYASSEFDIRLTIKWYTKESFLYGFVNGILRQCKDPTIISVLHPYFQDLFRAIFQLYLKQQKQKPKNGENYRSFYCYRGAALTKQQINKLKQNINSIVENLGFLSTSKYQQVAHGFMVNVLYKIKIEDSYRYDQLDAGYAFVQKYTSKIGEEEIIFNPLNTFKILQVTQYQDQAQMYIVHLQYGELARLAACHPSTLNQKQQRYRAFALYRDSTQSEIKLTYMKNALITSGYNLPGSLQYCQKLLQLSLQLGDQEQLCGAYCFFREYHQNRGQFKQMQYYAKKALSIARQLFGEKDVCYAYQLKHLARAQIGLKKYSKGIQHLENSLQLMQILNKDYINTLYDLCCAYQIQGDLQKALSYYNKIKQLCINKNGNININRNRNDYQLYLNQLSIIGKIYIGLRRYKQATQILEQAVNFRKIVHGLNDIKIVVPLISLACCYYRTKQFQKALPLLITGEYIHKKMIGQKQSNYVSILNYLGATYNKLKKFQVSITHFQKSKHIYRQKIKTVSDDEQKQYCRMIEELAIAYKETGNYKKAIQNLEQSVKIKKQTYLEDRTEYVPTLIHLASCLTLINQLQKSMSVLQQAQNIQLLNKNKEPLYGDTLYHIGVIYFLWNRLRQAQKYFIESIKIKEHFLQTNCIVYAVTLGYLGKVYLNMGQFNRAINYFKKFQLIMKKLSCVNSKEYGQFQNDLGTIYYNVGQPEKAVNIFQNSLKIFKETLGVGSSHYQDTLRILSLSYYEMGELQKSFQTCQKSGDKSMISMVLNKIQKKMELKTIFLQQNNNKDASNSKTLSNILNQIQHLTTQKDYRQVFTLIHTLKNLHKKSNNQHLDKFINTLHKKELQLVTSILATIECYHNQAYLCQFNGQFEEARYIYSELILNGFRGVFSVIAGILLQVQDDLVNLEENTEDVRCNFGKLTGNLISFDKDDHNIIY